MLGCSVAVTALGCPCQVFDDGVHEAWDAELGEKKLTGVAIVVMDDED